MDERTALLILATTPGLGSVKIRLLVRRYNSAQQALQATREELLELPGFGEKLVDSVIKWRESEAWTKEIFLAEQHGVELLSYTDPAYPKGLLELPDHPVLLFVKGQITPQDRQSIAIVGTRNTSLYGKEAAAVIARDLAAGGFTVVSGLARGIDTAAHEGALQNGRTIAVIGSGLANIYPRENTHLAERIAENGAMISEFPMQTPPDRQNFPQRNRIVSGMTLGTVLIEAPVKSGAMMTMNIALAQGKKTFALPGRADQETFRGNHRLIKEGKASLIEGAADIFSHFEDLFARACAPARQELRRILPDLEPEEREFLALFPVEEQNIDELARLANLPVSKLNILLMSLVLKKVVKEFPGQVYKKSF